MYFLKYGMWDEMHGDWGRISTYFYSLKITRMDDLDFLYLTIFYLHPIIFQISKNAFHSEIKNLELKNTFSERKFRINFCVSEVKFQNIIGKPKSRASWHSLVDSSREGYE